MKFVKLLSSLVIATSVMAMATGCTYADNQAWNSLSEKEELRAEFERVEGEIRADMSDEEFEAKLADFFLKTGRLGLLP